MGPLATRLKPNNVEAQDLGRLSNAWLAVKDGKVVSVGQGDPPAAYTACCTWQRIDARRQVVLPGLIDAHTHPLFAGSRAHEFAKRLAGATYQAIAAQGGGIQSTVRATRAASDEELLTLTRQRLQDMLDLGVTTIEVKSGYGLSVAEELRHLRLLTSLKRQLPQHLSITCLALHAVPLEYEQLADYVDVCTRELLPVIADEGLADWIDAFVETGYFSTTDLTDYVRRARELGLGLRLHADEFSNAGAAQAAADWGAKSADHLQYADSAGIESMAAADVTAILLPGTSLYTKIPFTSARPFVKAGVPVAIATDFNPGSCVIDNLAMMASVGAIHCGLNLAQAIAAVTYTAAYSLDLHRSKGALSPGYDADFFISPLSSIEEWLADFGRTPPSRVFIAGQQVASR